MSDLDEKIAASVRQSFAEAGLCSTTKILPPFNATPEADSDERQRRDREMQELQDRLGREEQDRRQREERDRRKHKRLSHLLAM